MKMANVCGIKQAQVIEVPEPRPVENWVKVKVISAPMCTEVKGFVTGDGAHGYGHEAAGEVVETAQPCCVKPGDRVVVQPGTPCGKCELCLQGEYIHCRNWYDFKAVTGGATGLATMAQFLLKQDWLLSPIPDDVSSDMASLAICGLGPTFGALEAMRVDAFDTVLITGLGAVGLGGIVNARYRGARVIGVENQPYRVNLAKELGAEAVIDPADPEAGKQILDLTGGLGPDKAVDCSGVPAAHALCLDTVRRKGHVSFVGQSKQDSSFNVSRHMIQKGLTMHGVWHYRLADYFAILQIIRQSPLAAKMITHTFPLDSLQQAWELQVSGNCGKVILHPWE